MYLWARPELNPLICILFSDNVKRMQTITSMEFQITTSRTLEGKTFDFLCSTFLPLIVSLVFK